MARYDDEGVSISPEAVEVLIPRADHDRTVLEIG